MKKALLIYLVASAGLVAVSLLTGRAATRRAGTPHYLLTRTTVEVEAIVPPESATDAAFDAAFLEDGEDTRMTVSQPQFVLGLLDATGPAILLGGAALGIAWAIRRRRRRVGN